MYEETRRDADAISRLTAEFNRLPGIGPKSAQRITYYLLRATEEQGRELAEAISTLKEKIRLCSVCCNVTEADPCLICANTGRNQASICIVEQPQDIAAIEHTGVFRGVYHVLHGAISPSEGLSTEDIRIRELMERLNGGAVEEVILATNTNLEGEQTALYLSRLISGLGVRVTRLARGLPYGTELEYADDVTLTRALEGRQDFSG